MRFCTTLSGDRGVWCRIVGGQLYVDCAPKGDCRDLLDFYSKQCHKIVHLALLKVAKRQFVACLEKLEKAKIQPAFCFGNDTHIFLNFVLGFDIEKAMAVLEGKSTFRGMKL